MDDSTAQASRVAVSGSALGTELQSLLTAGEIQPGSDPSYQTCKVIYLYHPLGAKMARGPIVAAMAGGRKIDVPDGPEEKLVEAFTKQWSADHVDNYIRNVATLSRVYGVSSVVVGAEGVEPADFLGRSDFAKKKLFFSVYDPLNTAGSLVLDQDPLSPTFQKWVTIAVQGKGYHRSRACVLLNEEPIYLAFTTAAFGYVGRSVYQRALFPLKSFVQTMRADDMVSRKAALLIAKLKAPGSIVDRLMQGVVGMKRALLKQAENDDVMSVDPEESIESLNLQNINQASETARKHVIENIALAADMPAKLLNQESFAEGFGEGTEDTKSIVRYLDSVRLWLAPVYAFFDRIEMARAWNEDFFAAIQKEYPEEYGGEEYEVVFQKWANSFSASWPSLLKEPESEQIKVEQTKFETVMSVVQQVGGQCDPSNKVRVLQWAADSLNANKILFASPLNLDYAALEDFLEQPPAPPLGAPGGEKSGGGKEPEGGSGMKLPALDSVPRSDASEFRESEHPRDEDGKFSEAGGGGKALVSATVGKDGKRLGANGEALPAHIAVLKLPPAWTDVKYNPDPRAALQATGKDTKGRVQYVYSQEFQASQAAKKFARIKELDGKLPEILKQNAAGRRSSDKRTRDAADCAALIMAMGIRPGSETDTKAQAQAYGATTLEGRHVVLTREGVFLQFVGKEGVHLNLPVRDNGLARMLLDRKRAAGETGQLFGVTDASLRDYVHTLDGGGFKTKDFRTLLGTRTATKIVAAMDIPQGIKEMKKAVHAVAVSVSRVLGNTPTVALQSYISPAVFGAWQGV